MPKYWKEIAIEAQSDAAYSFAAALWCRNKRDFRGWATYMEQAAHYSARARWAMSCPDDCP